MMNARALGTVLAALRYWQRHLEQGNLDDEFADISTDGGQYEPLNAAEIDALCQQLNAASDPIVSI